MDKTLSYFVYSPPKSNSHGHGVRDKNVKQAVQKTVDSFVHHFQATAGDPLEVTLYYDKRNEVECHHARETIEKINHFLGTPKSEWDNAGFEQFNNNLKWKSKHKDIFQVLDYIEQLDSDTTLSLSHFDMSCFYHYGQSPDAYGRIMCSIASGRLFVRLHLIFPYSIDEERVYKLLTHFQSGLPFKLNSKHFRRLGPGKQGYNQYKLDEDTMKRVEECLRNGVASGNP